MLSIVMGISEEKFPFRQRASTSACMSDGQRGRGSRSWFPLSRRSYRKDAPVSSRTLPLVVCAWTLPPASKISILPFTVVQVFDGFDAGDAQRPVTVRCVQRARRANVDGVINRYFHAFVLRVARGDGDGVRLGIDLNGNTLKIGLLVLRVFYRVNLHLVPVPALHVHGSVDVCNSKEPPACKI